MSKTHTPIPRYRHTGAPTLFQHGFRPFFLMGALWAALSLVPWLAMLHGAATAPPTLFAPHMWHAHEMIYGFVGAVVAGFLLTAIPNWTGRMPLQGAPLAGLMLLWLAGRAAMAGSVWIGAWPAAAVDLAFPAIFFVVVLREILAGRNWRNLPMAGAVLLLGVGNLLMHLEAAGVALPWGIGWRLGLGVTVVLIALVGGRIVPSFTRNWLARHDRNAPAPTSFGPVDKAALALTVVAMLGYAFVPEHAVFGGLALVAAAAQAWRLARWRGGRTLSEPLVWVLHLGYAWVPAGLALAGLGALLDAVPTTAGTHAFAAGAAGTMTLAVMTRATLGHTGRSLAAGPATVALYIAVSAAALTRVAAALLPAHAMALFGVSGLAWVAAFGGFALVYGRFLARPRADAG